MAFTSSIPAIRAYSHSLRRRSFSVKRNFIWMYVISKQMIGFFWKIFSVLNIEQQMALAILGFEARMTVSVLPIGLDKYSISLIFRLLLPDVHPLQQLSVKIK